MYFHLGQVEKCALDQHACSMGHEICFNNISILANSSSYDIRLARESIEIYLEAEVINDEEGTRLSDSWLPLLESLRKDMPVAVLFRRMSRWQHMRRRRGPGATSRLSGSWLGICHIWKLNVMY